MSALWAENIISNKLKLNTTTTPPAHDLMDAGLSLATDTWLRYHSHHSHFSSAFYGGGMGSLRGFRFSRVSRAMTWHGPDRRKFYPDWFGRGQLSPSMAKVCAGVVFTDIRRVESELQNSVQSPSSAAHGVRRILPGLGQNPMAIDLPLRVHRRTMTTRS